MSWGTVVGIVVFALVVISLLPYFRESLQTLGAVLRRPQAGRGALRGKTGVVRTALEPEGTISVEGELWQAVSRSGHLEAGTQVRVEKVNGLKLYVTEKETGGQ